MLNDMFKVPANRKGVFRGLRHPYDPQGKTTDYMERELRHKKQLGILNNKLLGVS